MFLRKVLLVLLMLTASAGAALADGRLFRVETGESLFSIFSNRLSDSTIINLEREIKQLIPDFNLKIGTIVRSTSSFVTLSPNGLTDISIKLLGNDAYKLKIVKYPVTTMTALVHGDVTSTLTDAMVQAGENPELAFKLADIYEWEVDFFHALRKGDSFTLLVEKKFAKNKFLGYGKIVAADFTNQGRTIRSVFYESGKTRGYFQPDGTSMKKGFLKSPLKFSRISSTYTAHRLHPVLNRYLPHYGVDFAAPVGTPIHSTADGVVVAQEYNQFNGRYIKIRHMNGYETLYLHMSKFASNVRKGTRVTQGTLIGYVGASGIASGPHLDYRIKQGEKFLNPLTFKSVNFKLPSAQKTAFKKLAVQYVVKLDSAYGKGSRFTMLRGSQPLREASPL